ncbi:DNA (cytosine-5-)-methyltransferase [Candidatus Peregrinibacteria bacterium RIFCSPLOWO2_02_FULL_48_14]|nr:MAG: DNA (cytosine-5-)-methyltransferase [Candidatus Peregrinibacteria bacterium RIFCSPLOWO2_01_FULL_48_20]OGJ43543.1 MAG: DNA (cytosine-5-)-methyltransferase [Candidatus Peregrinibacteria bacterium RIFCSPLOWO2_02_FULL_48_14]
MKKSQKLKFIDLFAGIGGFHLAFHNAGAECVFSSEWDDAARKTYEYNFKKISPELFKNGNFIGDINSIKDIENDIPDFDILTGGFPCQPFSNAGHKMGFEDTRGTLFFNIAEILRVKRPQAFFLENVTGLLNHNNGETFAKIREVLEEDLGYSFNFFRVKACDYGLPQLRPRVFMIGFKDKRIKFDAPAKKPLQLTMSEVFGGICPRKIGFTLRCGGRRSPIDDRRNWDGYIVDGEVKRVTSKEGKKMQGFPDGFEFPVNETYAMKQLGNSVAVPAIQAFAEVIVKALTNVHEESLLEVQDRQRYIQPMVPILGALQVNTR